MEDNRWLWKYTLYIYSVAIPEPVVLSVTNLEVVVLRHSRGGYFSAAIRLVRHLVTVCQSNTSSHDPRLIL